MTGQIKEITDPPNSKSGIRVWIKRCTYILVGAVVLLALVFGALLLKLRSGPVALPSAQLAVERIIQNSLSDFDVSVGEVLLMASEQDIGTEVQISDMRVSTLTGQKVVEFPIVKAKLDPIKSLFNGLQVENIEIVGAEIRVQRDLNNKYNFMPSGDQDAQAIAPEDIFAIVNKAAKTSPIMGLKLIDMVDAKLIYIDRINSQIWRSSRTNFQSKRDGDIITADANVILMSDSQLDTSVGLRFSYTVDETAFDFGFKFENAPTVDLANQVSALDWLRSFDATVTGSLNARVATAGVLETLSGVLETKGGQLAGSPQARQIKFSAGKAYFDYDKEQDTLNFTQITADSAAGSLIGELSVAMIRNEKGAVSSVAGDLALTKLELHPKGFFETPLVFQSASAQMHATLSPLTLTLERGKLISDKQEITVTGSSVGGDLYWSNAYFAQFNELDQDILVKFWPLNVKPKTRNWIKENVNKALARNGVAQLSTKNGKTKVDLKFDVEQGNVRYLKSLPVLQNAKGKGHLTEKTFDISLSEGHVIARNGDRLDLTGSIFSVPNLSIKPAIGDVTLKIKGDAGGVLSVLDEKPFEYLKKVNLNPDIASGKADVDAKLSVPLDKGTKPEDVNFQAKAEIVDVSSSTLIKNRLLTSKKITVLADDNKITLAGPVNVDGVPALAEWNMKIGKGRGKRSELLADLTLTAKSLRTFGLQFEDNAITGSALAKLKVKFEATKVPLYTLSSNLNGLGLNIASINWSKPKKTKGKIDITGQLGEVFTVDSLAIDAAGLKARGAIRFKPDGSFKNVDFTNLSVAEWLNAVVSIESTGQNTSKITISKGIADLRKVSFAKGAKTGAPMDVILDKLILSDGVVLTNVRAKLTSEKGLRGNYSAQVNGGAQIQGAIFPQQHGTAAEITAKNAGDVLRSANLYKYGIGGELRLIIVPQEQEGHYKGTFLIKKTRVKQDNVLADLLNAISVVGLVQQLSGSGIAFETIDGQFSLKPQGVELRKTSAVGASIGMTLNGNYSTATKQVNFEGVITPIYALNGTLQRVFGKLFGREKGEGLFSFVYNMSGLTSNPRIKVNPLSVLAPGAFREIFRTEMPEIDSAEAPAIIDPENANEEPAQKKKPKDLNLRDGR